ncbi:hypothetical protein CHS0354_008815 [Potamilus streckersoni]|uniref:Sodium-dependent glucose transporter 1 n=1 Tax=Potamilus streckersoni TaxID=2493646 RepID=A0AAE0SNU6_9BIVA|nr:hypothetical protein CHS0354_008815 [Potamilus streckersoni]
MSGDVKLEAETSLSIKGDEEENPYCDDCTTEKEHLTLGKDFEKQKSNIKKEETVKLHVTRKHITFAKDDVIENKSYSVEGNEERGPNQHGDGEIQGDRMQLLEGEPLLSDSETKENSVPSPEDDALCLIQNKADVTQKEGPIITKTRQSSTRSKQFVTRNRQASTRSNQSSTRSNQSSTRSRRSSANYANLPFCERLKKHRTFRLKVIRTAWLLASFVILGWVVAQIGPSLPDLMYLYDLKLYTISWMLTIHTGGYIVGSLVSGILFDKYDRLLLLFFSIFGIALTTSAWTWSIYFEAMAVIRFLDGMFCGSLDTGGNTEVSSLWREEGRPYMQALHFTFALGGVIAPMVTELFMTQKNFTQLQKKKPMIVEDLYFLPNEANKSYVNDTGVSMTLGIMDTFVVIPNATDPTLDKSDTNIRYSFVVSGCLALLASIPFIVMYFKYLRRLVLMDKPKPEIEENKLHGGQILALAVIALIFFCYYSIVESFGGYIMMFCISELEFTKKLGSLATSVFWAAFGVGRFFGIFVIRCLSPNTMLISYSVFVICSILGLTLACVYKVFFLIWIFVILFGFSTSVIFPTLFTFTEEKVQHVNGKISSLFLISSSVGMMIHPIFLGYMMEMYTPLWLLYVLTAESILCLFLLAVLLFVCKTCVNKPITRFAGMELHVQR